MERTRMPAWIIIERPGERIVRTSADDTPAALAVLKEILARRTLPDMQSPASIGALLRAPDEATHKEVGNDATPVSAVGTAPVSATAIQAAYVAA